MPEKDLIERAQHDPQAFGIIFDAHYSAILGYIVRRTGDVAVAEDMTSEVFIKALRALPKFRWQGVSIAAWLYKIATNELRMYYRRKKYTVSLQALQDDYGFEPVDEQDLAEELIAAQEALERHEQARLAQQYILKLPLKYQEVLTLRFGEQKKLFEIAAILDKKEGTVKSLLSRGLKMLRSAMDEHDMQLLRTKRIVPSEGIKNQRKQ